MFEVLVLIEEIQKVSYVCENSCRNEQLSIDQGAAPAILFNLLPLLRHLTLAHLIRSRLLEELRDIYFFINKYENKKQIMRK